MIVRDGKKGGREKECKSRRTINNSIPTPLFTSDYYIYHSTLYFITVTSGETTNSKSSFTASTGSFTPGQTNLPILPSFGTSFDFSISIQHREKTVRSVQSYITGFEFSVHFVVGGGVEGVDVWFVDTRAGEADGRASAKGDDRVAGLG